MLENEDTGFDFAHAKLEYLEWLQMDVNHFKWLQMAGMYVYGCEWQFTAIYGHL